jgi:Ni/Fe-hydrogenase b-type cytochrome subunit
MSAPPDPPPRTAARRHHGVVRLTHWLNAVFLTGMIGSGLQIYAAFPHIGSKSGVLAVPNPFDSDKIGGLPEAIRLGGWLAGGLRWHFTLAWPFVLTGLAYLIFLAWSGEWRKLLFRPRDVPGAVQMSRYYLRLRKDHPPQGKHNPLQKAAYTTAIVLAILAVLTGFAIAKPIQLGWLTAAFGGYELARYWHFVVVWAFTLFTIMHVVMVLVADRASLRAIITGRYRGRFPDAP